MNSLNILSSRVDKVIGNTPPSTPRAEPFRPLKHPRASEAHGAGVRQYQSHVDEEVFEDEEDHEEKLSSRRQLKSVVAGERMYMALLNPWLGAFRWILSTLAASSHWLVACVCDNRGAFAPLMPLRRLAGYILHPFGKGGDGSRKPNYPPPEEERGNAGAEVSHEQERTADNELVDRILLPDPSGKTSPLDSNGREEISPRRSIRIRLYNEQSLHQKTTPSSVKSPTSPSPSPGLRLTKYPRISGPPHPLLSRNPSTKTLILDLDETLIHSLAKGGRMSSGHMVEVKLDRQHAILYYVHKRPFCDEFLRKVCRWYDLVVFTASVQEYADPVIDWLEQDRKYFKGRYYRQHCTMRNGAYIKDITAVEPDLSKVMIVDNSPMSYIFHEDNAIPIEGWINDPTDVDLLYLIPLLQALQYVPDVRALLALRMGESFP